MNGALSTAIKEMIRYARERDHNDLILYISDRSEKRLITEYLREADPSTTEIPEDSTITTFVGFKELFGLPVGFIVKDKVHVYEAIVGQLSHEWALGLDKDDMTQEIVWR